MVSTVSPDKSWTRRAWRLIPAVSCVSENSSCSLSGFPFLHLKRETEIPCPYRAWLKIDADISGLQRSCWQAKSYTQVILCYPLLGRQEKRNFSFTSFPSLFFFHLTLYWFLKIFVYLAALGLSWDMQNLVPWSGIKPRTPELEGWSQPTFSWWSQPPGKSLPFTCETNLSLLVLLSPLTWGQKQFAPSNCTPLAFSAQAADFGVQAAYSSSMSSRQTQLFCTWPWHRINAVSFLFQWTACSSGLRLWGNRLCQVTRLVSLAPWGSWKTRPFSVFVSDPAPGRSLS